MNNGTINLQLFSVCKCNIEEWQRFGNEMDWKEKSRAGRNFPSSITQEDLKLSEKNQ